MKKHLDKFPYNIKDVNGGIKNTMTNKERNKIVDLFMSDDQINQALGVQLLKGLGYTNYFEVIEFYVNTCIVKDEFKLMGGFNKLLFVSDTAFGCNVDCGMVAWHIIYFGNLPFNFHKTFMQQGFTLYISPTIEDKMTIKIFLNHIVRHYEKTLRQIPI